MTSNFEVNFPEFKMAGIKWPARMVRHLEVVTNGDFSSPIANHTLFLDVVPTPEFVEMVADKKGCKVDVEFSLGETSSMRASMSAIVFLLPTAPDQLFRMEMPIDGNVVITTPRPAVGPSHP